jgi:hypothetical protein
MQGLQVLPDIISYKICRYLHGMSTYQIHTSGSDDCLLSLRHQIERYACVALDMFTTAIQGHTPHTELRGNWSNP